MSKTINKIETISNNLPTLKRVCAYARVSSGKDAMLQSLAAQISYYSSYIQRHPDWQYVGVFADEATTGTKENRVEFQNMLTDCRNGKIDMIITKSISRFARNTVLLLETVRELKTLNVDVYFEEQNIHSFSGDGELMLTILASYAQEESLSVSENCKWRIRKNFKEGLPNSPRIYGYDTVKGKLLINNTEAEVVRMVFADYLKGMGKNAIVRKLQKMNAPTKNAGKWCENTIAIMLLNEKYSGNMLLQKTYSFNHLTKKKMKNNGNLPMYYAQSTHEGIIDMDTFEAVQVEIARRKEIFKHNQNESTSEFTGIIRCGMCGANFRRKTNNIGTKYAKTIWSCSTYNTRGKDFCGAKQIPEYIIQNLFKDIMGLNVYDSAVFTKTLNSILVPENGVIIFVLKDGTEVTRNWDNPSRSLSWTQEMKELARRQNNV